MSELGARCWRVLIVDDVERFRQFLLKALSSLGFDALGVGGSEECRDAIASYRPDVILLDWHLDGEAATELLAFIQECGIPAIVMTGDPEGVGDIGVPVLGKPLRIALLKGQLEETCRSS
jgi:DNA-binding response OmpR family regulator